MNAIHARSRVGPDGKVVIAVGAEDAGKDVYVTIVPAPPPMTREQWRAFVERTGGSITDSTFERQPQGDYEVRDSFD